MTLTQKLGCLVMLILGVMYFSISRKKGSEVDRVHLVVQNEPKEANSIMSNSDSTHLEVKYSSLLAPIKKLKKTDNHLYWFIVSWLNTKYKTPDWRDYSSEEWISKTKKRGIDCSGFARVLQDQIFDKRIRGGSQGIFDRYCKPIDKKNLEKGDLVFFKAPFSDSNRIVHVGTYLIDDYFVHATSTKSASIGLGLNISSLNEKRWIQTFVSGGRIHTQ